jgi:hypothetical protein
MHRALKVADIRYHIFTFIKADSDRISRRTFAALAGTCTTFRDDSLNVLWSELRSLRQLVSCIRGTNMKLNDKARLQHPCVAPHTDPPIEQDKSKINTDAGPNLSVFNEYAHRVRKLELSGYEGGWPKGASAPFPDASVPDDLRVFRDLQVPTPLLPKLTHLACADYSLALIWPLLNDGLLSLHISGFQWSPESTPLLLSEIPRFCPKLKSLGLLFYRSDRYEAIAESCLSRVICSWENLEVLDYSPVGRECISSLSALLSLRHLRLRIDNIFDLDVLPAEPFSFPSLHTLQFQANSLATSNYILRALKSLPKSIDICLPVYHSGDVGAETVDPILQPIGQDKSRGNLEEFRMDIPAFLSNGIVNSSNVLQPLFFCRNLRVLRVIMTPLFLLTDDDLRAMASAWPLLEELELFDCRNLYTQVPFQPSHIGDLADDPLPVLPPLVGLPPIALNHDAMAPFPDFERTDPRNNRAAEITFHGLISLLKLCPNLRFFNLAIDATKLDGLRGDKPGGGVCNRLVKYPRLVDSHINDSEAVAHILLDILPELETLWGEGSPGPITDLLSLVTMPQGWKQVQQKIRNSKVARRL